MQVWLERHDGCGLQRPPINLLATPQRFYRQLCVSSQITWAKCTAYQAQEAALDLPSLTTAPGPPPGTCLAVRQQRFSASSSHRSQNESGEKTEKTTSG